MTGPRSGDRSASVDFLAVAGLVLIWKRVATMGDGGRSGKPLSGTAGGLPNHGRGQTPPIRSL